MGGSSCCGRANATGVKARRMVDNGTWNSKGDTTFPEAGTSRGGDWLRLVLFRCEQGPVNGPKVLIQHRVNGTPRMGTFAGTYGDEDTPPDLWF
jgi:hypothetical protein